MSARDELAAAYDPAAFDNSVKKSTRDVAVIQWAARRKLATDAADRVLASDWLKAHDKSVGEQIVLAIKADAASWPGAVDRYEIGRADGYRHAANIAHDFTVAKCAACEYPDAFTRHTDWCNNSHTETTA